MKIIDETSLMIRDGNTTHHLWVLFFWERSMPFLKVMVNGEHVMVLGYRDADRLAETISVQQGIARSLEEKIIDAINGMLVSEKEKPAADTINETGTKAIQITKTGSLDAVAS